MLESKILFCDLGLRRIRGRKNTKCYVSTLYRDTFSSPMMSQNPLLNPKQFFKDTDNSKKEQLRKLVFGATIAPLLEQGYFFDLERYRLDTAIEEKRKVIKGKKTEGVSFEQLKNIIVYSETIFTKKQACKKYGITTKNLDENIRRSYRLQYLRSLIRGMMLEADKSSKVIIPYEKDGRIVQLLRIKRKEAEKRGLI